VTEVGGCHKVDAIEFSVAVMKVLIVPFQISIVGFSGYVSYSEMACYVGASDFRVRGLVLPLGEILTVHGVSGLSSVYLPSRMVFIIWTWNIFQIPNCEEMRAFAGRMQVWRGRAGLLGHAIG
jgi:hypothetical protein